MDREQVLEIFRQTGVMLEGHFLLTSGRHSDRYVQCARLFEWPEHSARLSADLAAQFKDAGVDLVVGLAMGSVILAYEVARQLHVRNVFAERENGRMTLRRGFDVAPGTKVLVVEDVVTTGGSVREVVDLLRDKGAQVAGVGAIVDRSNGQVDFGCPFRAVITLDVRSWPADDCALCRAGTQAVKPGSRGLGK